jgi:hypothetical protein
VARLYPQALGSLFVASYDSQGYGGGILPRLNMGLFNLLKREGCLNSVKKFSSYLKESKLQLYYKDQLIDVV